MRPNWSSLLCLPVLSSRYPLPTKRTWCGSCDAPAGAPGSRCTLCCCWPSSARHPTLPTGCCAPSPPSLPPLGGSRGVVPGAGRGKRRGGRVAGRPYPRRRRSLFALLKQAPSAFGWSRRRWSCATLAASVRGRRGWAMWAETVRRRLHAPDDRRKRAKHIAKDNDPARVPSWRGNFTLFV